MLDISLSAKYPQTFLIQQFNLSRSHNENLIRKIKGKKSTNGSGKKTKQTLLNPTRH